MELAKFNRKTGFFLVEMVLMVEKLKMVDMTLTEQSETFSLGGLVDRSGMVTVGFCARIAQFKICLVHVNLLECNNAASCANCHSLLNLSSAVSVTQF